MSTATKTTGSTTTSTLKKPMVCEKCKATHFTYQLTCKRCGNYLSKEDSVAPAKNMTGLIAVAGLILGACGFAAAKCFHIL